MSDDTTSGPRAAPEEGELQLRKALSTMNDLEPPRDDLFAQRALMRGRARTSRRRSTLLGAAAALVVVGAVGGSWMALSQGGGSASTASAGSAPEVMKDATGSAGADNGARGPGTLSGSLPPTAVDLVPSAPPARDTTRWFGTLSTRQTNAFTAVEPTVAARWPDVFSGAYAADAAGARVAVVVTRHDAELEAFVTAAMPSPTDVEFVVMKHTLAEKEKVAKEIVDQRMLWRSKGIEIIAVTQDARTDRVLVMADEGSSAGLIAQQYGDIVRVVPATQTPPGKSPDGSTLPPLQQ
ncbi:hypothetical protein ASH01_04380 [Terrabacter sp. Soil811]|uniref:hypothetical protein n=1 Tax=Terrabacter sp. Soil811 TaxID=1736419 RepID=UPI000700C2F4|nr:hypothetical protein [Terrabacter sp. Soil811]KRF48904.1 hypothetical protein ASH01_04380 [Terrabacter sp. Soil811]